jgi:hypothetical protein
VCVKSPLRYRPTLHPKWGQARDAFSMKARAPSGSGSRTRDQRNPSVRLFLSCVSGEFGAYRDALRRALTRPNVEVEIQEDFKALGGDTLKMLAEYVERCEAVVHFVGDMAGSAPAASSVDDLLKRRPELETRLAEKGLGRDALRTHSLCHHSFKSALVLEDLPFQFLLQVAKRVAAVQLGLFNYLSQLRNRRLLLRPYLFLHLDQSATQLRYTSDRPYNP